MRTTLRLCLSGLVFFLIAQATAQSDRWVDSTLHSLPVEEKVGQLFVMELAALFTNQAHPAYQYGLEMIQRYHCGGFILAGGTVLEIAQITNRLQMVSKVPLLINADLEAGMTFAHPWRLQRGWTDRLPAYISGGGTQFPSQMAIGATGNPDWAREMGRVTALEARAVGIHWSNSPVADVNINAENPVINTRSFGEDPVAVAAMVAAYVKGATAGGMISTLKHFPGHGDTREDSHMKLPSLPMDRARLNAVELVPFRAGIKAGAPAVMTAHLALPLIDPSGLPATLSSPILTGILRNDLEFRGIVVTDGMRMQGITDQFSAGEAAVRALEAGADVVLGPEDIGGAFDGVVAAVRSGRITASHLDQSVRRVLSAKRLVGLAEKRTVDIDAIFRNVGTPEFQKIATDVSNASVTLLRNEGSIVPINPKKNVMLISVTEDPWPTAGVDMERQLQSHVASTRLLHVSNETGREQFAHIDTLCRSADVVVVGIYLSVIAWKGERRFAPPLDDFLMSLGTFPRPIILVAYGDPYVLGKLPITPGIVTPYNGTVEAEISVARALTGEIPVNGKLPVTIPGRYHRGEGISLPASSQH